MTDSMIPPEYKAYARVPSRHPAREREIADRLDDLLAAAKRCESPLLREMKPVIALSLKWKFDLLAKTLDSPFELERDVAYWTEMVDALETLGQQRWFERSGALTPSPDVWARTAHGFDVGWTTTTGGARFAVSREIARERLEQILAQMGGSDWVRGKEILDSGCGPGRYVDLLSKLDARRIVALDQGPALIEALRTRFGGVSHVEIVRGTCEKLEFPDGSFDFVLSNGVLHHTGGDLRTMLADHARVLRTGGIMFIMLMGTGGLELALWKFLRAFLYDVPVESMLARFGPLVSPLRLQGIVDHMYGEYQETDRSRFEAWCADLFSRIERVPGVGGLDITPELYQDDPFFAARFGCGQLRYLCYK
jgi:ubiquinone/menaquinone biosynthesis C-methylase UbiE